MISKEVKTMMRQIFNDGVKWVSGRQLVREELRVVREGDLSRLRVRQREYKLEGNCYVVGFGKAVLEMGLEVETILGSHLRKGILSVPEGSVCCAMKTNLEILEGARNNIPDDNSMRAASRIVELVDSLREGDLLLALVSGGGSALLPLPVGGITLDEKIRTINLLSSAGADITQLNVIRTFLSQVKGGKLVERAHPASVVALILSDIVGDPLHLIASGPTVPPNSEVSIPPLSILKRYSVEKKIPQTVSRLLENSPLVRASDVDVQNIIVGNNTLALTGAKKAAIDSGYTCLVMSSSVQGLVSEIASAYSTLVALICRALSAEIDRTQFEKECEKSICKDIKLSYMNSESCVSLVETLYSNDVDNKKLCLLFGGEPTVQVLGNGLGGRNQELALRFSIEVTKHEDALEGYDVALLSCGTDGIDGPTDAAGALAYTGQLNQAKQQALDYNNFLRDNDSYSYYLKINGGEDHIITGHTFTNVMDIHILIIQPKTEQR